MRALSAPEMLAVWERGQMQSLPQRLLMLLGTATTEAAASMSAGERDTHLLALRELAFGPQLCAVASCPSCAAQLELNFRTSDVSVAAEVAPADGWPVSVAEYELRCRAPNSLDLIASAAERDPASARGVLLARCLSDVKRAGVPVAVTELPAEVVSAAVASMAQADAQANAELALACPQCGHQWQVGFDIGSFFWSEIHAWAQRTLREVHVLAAAYGWSEQGILTLSPWRRQFYLNCIGR